MKELIPLDINCQLVSYKKELEKARLIQQDDSFISRKNIIKHLNWLKKNNIKLYYRPEGKVDYVYLFEYKGGVCRFSAVTLKVHFTQRSGKTWYQYKMSDQLLSLLEDREANEIRKEASNDIITIDLRDVAQNGMELCSQAQFDYVISLLNKFGYIFNKKVKVDELTSLKKKSAALMIEVLRNGKQVEFIREEFMGEEYLEDTPYEILQGMIFQRMISDTDVILESLFDKEITEKQAKELIDLINLVHQTE
jgi:hypothetical protein